MTRKFLSRVVIALAVLVLVPSMALAQAGSSIAGGVTDNTGGVLPGVTVEASSPALIGGQPRGIYRRARPVQHHRPQTRALFADLYAARLLDDHP